MTTTNDLLANLTSVLSTLSAVQQDVVAMGGQMESAQRQADAAFQDTGRAAINMRDYILSNLNQWAPNIPMWVIQRIAALQLQQDDQGEFTRDAVGNFTIK